MTVTVTKPTLNIREELTSLKKPSGAKGEEILRSNTVDDFYRAVGTNKNFIINGNMRISQRGDYSAGITHSQNNGINTTYFMDRWQNAVYGGTGGTQEVKHTTVTLPTGEITRAMKITQTAVNATTATPFFHIMQPVEAESWMLSRPITISAWVRTNHPNQQLRLCNSIGCFGIGPVIPSDGQWHYVTGTYIPPASDAINGLLGNKIQIHPAFNTIAGGDVGVGKYVEFTNVQMEFSQTASPFEYRTYQQELALCQRYYIKFSAADGNGGYATLFDGEISNNTLFLIYPKFPVVMRSVNQAQTIGGTLRVANAGSSFSVAASSLSASNQQIGQHGGYGVWNMPSQSTFSANTRVRIEGNGDANAYWAFSAEL